MYVHIQTEPGLWTVGHYKPDGKFEPCSDHADEKEAAQRVAKLNGCAEKSDNNYLDYGGGGDYMHNENSGPHKRYGG